MSLVVPWLSASERRKRRSLPNDWDSLDRLFAPDRVARGLASAALYLKPVTRAALWIGERSRAVVLGALLLGLAARLWLASSFVGNFDETSYEIVAAIMQRGGNVFAETSRYNYSPVWAYLLLAFSQIGGLVDLPLHTVVRSFLAFVDVGNAALLGAIGAQLRLAKRSTIFAVYALNPVAILVVGYHGQFETLAASFVLLAMWLELRSPERRDRYTCWALATAALLVKHIVVFSTWTLLAYRYSRLRTLLLAFGAAVAVFLLSFAPFLADGRQGIWLNVFKYRAAIGWYGTSSVLTTGVVEALFLAAMIALPLVARGLLRLSLVEAMELAAVALLVLIPGISEQYFLLPVIFGSLRRTGWYWAFCAVTTVFFLFSPNNIQVLPAPIVGWNAIWLVTIGWACSFFFGLRLRQAPLRAERSSSRGPGSWAARPQNV